jgi:hypothetical protein
VVDREGRNGAAASGFAGPVLVGFIGDKTGKSTLALYALDVALLVGGPFALLVNGGRCGAAARSFGPARPQRAANTRKVPLLRGVSKTVLLATACPAISSPVSRSCSVVIRRAVTMRACAGSAANDSTMNVSLS